MNRLRRFVPVVISLVLLVILASYAPWDKIGGILADFDLGTVTILVSLSLAYYSLKTVRFWYLLKARSSFDIRRPLLPRGDGLPPSQIPNHDRFGNAGSARTLLFTRNFLFLAIGSLLALSYQGLRLHSLEGSGLDIVFNVSLCAEHQ